MAKVVGLNEGKSGPLGAIGVRFMIWGEESEEGSRSSSTRSAARPGRATASTQP